MNGEVRLRSQQFRRERQAAWEELEFLVDLVERDGIKALGPADLANLPMLYRNAASGLSVARSISLDRNLVEYLEALVARAYVVVYASRRPPGEVLADFFLRRFPRLVRHFGRELLLATALLLAGVAAGAVLTHADPGRYGHFVPPERAQGRNFASSAESLRAGLYDTQDRVAGLDIFASFLFTNNARVGLICASLGVLAGVPVALLLVREGLALGAMGALFASRGLLPDFLLWVLPHGVTELLGLLLCAAAGLALARALLFPGAQERVAHVAAVGREAALLVAGTVLMFFAAGLVEGLFRQLVPDVGPRAAVAAGSALFWALYLGVAGRGSRA